MKTKTFTPVATVPDFTMLTWVSQAIQYENFSAVTGVVHKRFPLNDEDPRIIDCVLYYSEAGQLLGILNYYEQDIEPWEKAGNVNIWVHPDATRKGIGTKLVAYADETFGINWEQQRYSDAGAKFARKYLESKS